jgi:hypothetical protein
MAADVVLQVSTPDGEDDPTDGKMSALQPLRQLKEQHHEVRRTL